MTCTCAATGGKMCPAHGEPWPVAKVLEERAKYERHIGALAAENQRLAERVRAADLDLSRILHEMAGAVSLCWKPRPTGEFESTQAAAFVADAIAEIRAAL